jgi:hypothetical protein
MIVILTTKFIGVRMMESKRGMFLLILPLFNLSLKQKIIPLKTWESLLTNSWSNRTTSMAWDLILLCFMHR